MPNTPIALLFALDGTLTDSAEGVINCAALALTHFGLPCSDRWAMRRFIGPPLRESFPLFGVSQDRVEEAVEIFRSRYNTVGKFENRPYEGIRELLEDLRALGFPLYVATSKPERTARQILDKFGLSPCFDRICGADFEGKRETKEAVLETLLSDLPRGTRALMIGDTIYDVAGANRFGIPTVGVSWGFGDTAEMTAGGAVAIVDSPAELKALLLDEEFVRKVFK